MNNKINSAINIIGSEIINTLQDIATPIVNNMDFNNMDFNNVSIKYHIKDLLDYIFICLELPGITKEDCKIEFIGGYLIVKAKTNYQLSNCDNISVADFNFINNKNITKKIDITGHNINETSIQACYINGLLKIKLKKKPKTNINIH
jgi:HSP20 family molecular chaperone IbpA